MYFVPWLPALKFRKLQSQLRRYVSPFEHFGSFSRRRIGIEPATLQSPATCSTSWSPVLGKRIVVSYNSWYWELSWHQTLAAVCHNSLIRSPLRILGARRPLNPIHPSWVQEDTMSYDLFRNILYFCISMDCHPFPNRCDNTTETSPLHHHHHHHNCSLL